MNRLVSKIVSFALSAAVVSSIAIIPSVSVSAAGVNTDCSRGHNKR